MFAKHVLGIAAVAAVATAENRLNQRDYGAGDG